MSGGVLNYCGTCKSAKAMHCFQHSYIRCMTCVRREWRKRSTPDGLHAHCEAGAERRGIRFHLSIPDIAAKLAAAGGRCEYCQDSLTYRAWTGLKRVQNPSTFVWNIAICCINCNMAKNKLDVLSYIDLILGKGQSMEAHNPLRRLTERGIDIEGPRVTQIFCMSRAARQRLAEMQALTEQLMAEQPATAVEGDAGHAGAGGAEARQAEAGQAEGGVAEAGQAKAGQAEGGEHEHDATDDDGVAKHAEGGEAEAVEAEAGHAKAGDGEDADSWQAEDDEDGDHGCGAADEWDQSDDNGTKVMTNGTKVMTNGTKVMTNGTKVKTSVTSMMKTMTGTSFGILLRMITLKRQCFGSTRHTKPVPRRGE